MRRRSQSAIDRAWRDLDKLIAKWDAEGYPEVYFTEIPDPPTLPDAHYIDVSQLSQWRKENTKPTK